MSVSPDFSVMLDSIMSQAGEVASSPSSALLIDTTELPPFPPPLFPLRILAFGSSPPDEEPLPDEETGTGIADAVIAGCAGMADRRFTRGDAYGAVHWQEAADAEHRPRPRALPSWWE